MSHAQSVSSRPVVERIHGGPDRHGVPRWDFSTNSNACGPCPLAWQAVQQADGTRYPDPSYHALRERLAAFHGVTPARVVLAASASEAIFRLSACLQRMGRSRVGFPRHAYGDYRAAAQAWGLREVHAPADADAVWHCCPSSPLGQAEAVAAEPNDTSCAPWVFWDAAYEPLRLDRDFVPTAMPFQPVSRVWRLWSPNKSLGLTGVRGAYLIAPPHSEEAVQWLQRLAPSWPLGAHAVAMLQTWTEPAVQDWLRQSRTTLQAWKTAMWEGFSALGWALNPSVTPFFCVAPDGDGFARHMYPELQRHGIKWRDATSFDLPGWWRLSAQPPEAQQVLFPLLREWQRAPHHFERQLA